MINIVAKGLAETIKKMEGLQKQMRFASAVALTMTAQAAQEKILLATRERFTIRGAWLRKGGRYGIRINPATKAHLEARVYNEAPWMQLQEEGGTKKPKSGKKIAIPTENVKRTKKELVRASQRPRALKNAFFFQTGHQFSFLKQHPRGKAPPRTMYIMTESAKIPATWHFVETGKAEVARVFEVNFEKALAKAIATAK